MRYAPQVGALEVTLPLLFYKSWSLDMALLQTPSSTVKNFGLDAYYPWL